MSGTGVARGNSREWPMEDKAETGGAVGGIAGIAGIALFGGAVQ